MLEPWKISNSYFKFGPSFAPAQLAWALQGFLSRPTCLPPVLAGGSTVKSSLQLQPNKSWSRIPVNRGRASPRPSLADSESHRAAQQLLGRQSVPAWTPLAGSVLQPTCAFTLAEPTWVSGKFKSKSREPGALLDPLRTSDTSQKVQCDASVGFSDYIPCINHTYHHEMHAGSVVV